MSKESMLLSVVVPNINGMKYVVGVESLQFLKRC